MVYKVAKKLLTPKPKEIIAKYANVTVQPQNAATKAIAALANYVDKNAIR